MYTPNIQYMNGEKIAALRRELKSGVEKAKQRQDVEELYTRIATMQKEGTLDKSLYSDFGWLIYYLLRNTPLNSVLRCKRYLIQYLNLQLPRPSLLHSLMLSIALKLKKKIPSQFRIMDFLNLWGVENLRDEDFEKFKPESGRSHNSMVENMISICAKELKSTGNYQVNEEFAKVIDKALLKHETNPHLPLYKATVLVAQGNKKEALEYYKTLLRRWPRKFFLWSNAEELVPYTEKDLKIALLCKAITTARDKAFLGDIRLRLANQLYKKGLYSNALHELEQYEIYYTSQGWQIKSWCETLVMRVKAAAPGVKATPTQYNDYITLAEKFIKK